MRIATLRAPGAPVTSASPMVIITASSLLAANASMEGAYSNQSNFTSTPASLNQPFSTPISKAVQPGQSLNATRSGGFAGGGAGAAGAAAGAGAGAAACSLLQPSRISRSVIAAKRLFMAAE